MKIERAKKSLAESGDLLKRLTSLQKSISKTIKPKETSPIISSFHANACLDEAIWGLMYCQKSIIATIDILEAQNEKTKGRKKKEDNG